MMDSLPGQCFANQLAGTIVYCSILVSSLSTFKFVADTVGELEA